MTTDGGYLSVVYFLLETEVIMAKELTPNIEYQRLASIHDKLLWLHKYKKWELGLNDKIDFIRLTCYQKLGFTEECFYDGNIGIQLAAYKALGWPEEAKNNTCPVIRYEAYQALGWTEEALKDDNSRVRHEAYCVLGFTEEALDDPSDCISTAAKRWFQL